MKLLKKRTRTYENSLRSRTAKSKTQEAMSRSDVVKERDCMVRCESRKKCFRKGKMKSKSLS